MATSPLVIRAVLYFPKAALLPFYGLFLHTFVSGSALRIVGSSFNPHTVRAI